MLNWKKRIAEWRSIVRDYGRGHHLGMIIAIASGPVPEDVWRTRMRVCLRCPILDRERMACRKALSDGRTLGCNCYTPFLALTAAPYPRGCFARQITDYDGWPSYIFASWREKVCAVWRFIRQ